MSIIFTLSKGILSSDAICPLLIPQWPPVQPQWTLSSLNRPLYGAHVSVPVVPTGGLNTQREIGRERGKTRQRGLCADSTSAPMLYQYLQQWLGLFERTVNWSVSKHHIYSTQTLVRDIGGFGGCEVVTADRQAVLHRFLFNYAQTTIFGNTQSLS